MDITQQIAEAIKDHETRLHKRNGRFVPPTVAEVVKYAGQGFDAENFIDFYESKGWKVGNQPMKSWRAAVRTWCRREQKAEDINEKLCIVDRNPGIKYSMTRDHKKVWLCADCLKGWGQGAWGWLSPAQIEKRVLAGKAERTEK